MNAEHLVEAQRELRTRLLDREHVAWHPARELAARLLLHLDDTQFCWQFAAEWLRDTLDADRVDGGFGAPTIPVYRPHAEARRATREVPSMLGASIDASDRGVRYVWSAARAVVFRDVEQDPRLGTGLRDSLLASGMRNTLAAALVHQGTPLGLVCVDWMERRVDDSDDRCEHFQEVARVVLSPILATSRRLGMEPSLLTRLSPAERRVAGARRCGTELQGNRAPAGSIGVHDRSPTAQRAPQARRSLQQPARAHAVRSTRRCAASRQRILSRAHCPHTAGSVPSRTFAMAHGVTLAQTGRSQPTSGTTMKAAVIRAFGAPDVIRVEEIATPTPGPGQVLVKVLAAGVNRLDHYVRLGQINPNLPFPHVLGSDAAGEVAALGAGVTRFKVGERVIAMPAIR